MTDLLGTIDPYVWLAILGVTAATFITRSSLFVLGARVQFPPVVEAALRFAPACALAAIVAADLAFSITRSIIGTIAGGMIVFWLLHFWLPML
jgi:branched-subunit amino acid transport protein